MPNPNKPSFSQIESEAREEAAKQAAAEAAEKEKQGSAVKQPEVEQLKPEEVDKLAESALESLGFAPKKKEADAKQPSDEEKRKAEEKAAADKAKADAEKADKEKGGKGVDEKKKPTVTKRQAPAPKPEVDPAKIATEAARAVAAELNKGGGGGEGGGRHELSDEEREDIETMKMLEELDPSKYKGHADKTRKFIKDVLNPYRDKWLKEHPGEAFDPDSDEHEAVYKQQPQVTPDDWQSAKDELRINRKAEQIFEKKFGPKLTEIEKKNAERAILPKIESEAHAAIESLVKAVDPELAKLIGEEDEIKKMAELDPIATEVLDRAAGDLRVLVTELDKLSTPELQYGINDRNPAHRALINFATGYESEIKKMPAKDQLWNGKKFATQEEYGKMNRADQAQHWVLSGQDIREVLIERFANGVKQDIEAARDKALKFAEKRGMKKSDSAPNPDPKDEEAKRAAAAAAEEEKKKKPTPPAGGDSSKINGSGGSASGGKSLEESVVDVLFAR